MKTYCTTLKNYCWGPLCSLSEPTHTFQFNQMYQISREKYLSSEKELPKFLLAKKFYV